MSPMPLARRDGVQSVQGSTDIELSEYPIILSKNYVGPKIVDFEKDYTNVAADSQQALVPNMLDRDPDTYWESSGYNDDITGGLYITIDFYEGDTVVDRWFDSIILINHNLKFFYMQYQDPNSAWINIRDFFWFTPDTPPSPHDLNYYESTTFRLINPVYARKIRLYMAETIDVNEEKRIGEFMVMNTLVQFPDGLDMYNPQNIAVEGSFRLSNGNLNRWNTAEKYACRWGVEMATKQFIDILKTDVYDLYSEFNWYPEPLDKTNDIYLVQWMSKWTEPYSYKWKGAGYNVGAEFQEV